MEEAILDLDECIRELSDAGLDDESMVRLLTAQISVNQAREIMHMSKLDSADADALMCTEPYAEKLHLTLYATRETWKYCRNSDDPSIKGCLTQERDVYARGARNKLDYIEFLTGRCDIPDRMQELSDLGLDDDSMARLLTAQISINQAREILHLPKLKSKGSDSLCCAEPFAEIYHLTLNAVKKTLEYFRISDNPFVHGFIERQNAGRPEGYLPAYEDGARV